MLYGYTRLAQRAYHRYPNILGDRPFQTQPYGCKVISQTHPMAPAKVPRQAEADSRQAIRHPPQISENCLYTNPRIYGIIPPAAAAMDPEGQLPFVPDPQGPNLRPHTAPLGFKVPVPTRVPETRDQLQMLSTELR